MKIVASTTPGRSAEGLTQIPRKERRPANKVIVTQRIPVISYDLSEYTGLFEVPVKSGNSDGQCFTSRNDV